MTTCGYYGRALSPFAATGLPIRSQTVSQMIDILMALEDKFDYIFGTIVRHCKIEYRKEIAELHRKVWPGTN